MVIKLINKYFNTVWLIEIVYLILYLVYSIFDLITNQKYGSEFFGYNGEKYHTIHFIAYTVIATIISIKLICFISKKDSSKAVHSNFLISFCYVMKNGFKYKNSRRMLTSLIAINTLLFIIYLYSIAMGSYGSNIISRFITLYPIKGFFVILLFPTVAIIYIVKNKIEISKINERIINNDDIKELQKDITLETGNETIELINNISILKERYIEAVNETINNERLKTELITNVSHDLRTPLTSIINYVDILQNSDISHEEKDDYLKILEYKSKKLKGIIDNLFEMSKINSGKLKINREKIDIVALIYQSVGEYSSMANDKKLEFSVNSSLEMVEANLDGKMISRAIENIIINAIKYSLENTRIYIDIKCNNNNIVLSFKNISNYHMDFNSEEIFERFVRGDKARSSQIEGSGLGLAITKSIIELHGGKVSIKPEGDMFKFYIVLPK